MSASTCGCFRALGGEQLAVDHERLDGIEGRGGRVARTGRHDRELTEELTGSHDAHRCNVAEGGVDPQSDMTV